MIALAFWVMLGVWALWLDWWWAEVAVSGTDLVWKLDLTVHACGIRRHRTWRLPSAARSGQPATAFDPGAIRDGILAFRLYRRFVHGLTHRISVEWFECDIRLGLGDPSHTAMAVAWVNLVMGWWLGTKIASKAVLPPKWRVDADWNRIGIQGRMASRIKIKGWMMVQAVLEVAQFGLRDVLGRARRQISWHRLRRIFTMSANIPSRD